MNLNKKTIHFLAASDRLNYGDLLFPVLFLKYLEDKDVEFLNYGIIKSDFSNFKALPTKSYRTFQKNVKKIGGNVIVGGGEVFFAEWNTLFSFINPLFAKFNNKKKYKLIDEKFGLSRKLLSKGKVLIPFAPSVKELNNDTVKIFYNSVGGNFNDTASKEKNKHIKEALVSAEYISVRDERACNSLKKKGINSNLIPDSAIIMSDVFSKDELEINSALEAKLIDKNYIFIQIGINKKPNNLNQFARELELQLLDLNVTAILCPIGLAPNHEDDIVLKELVCLSNLFEYYLPKNMFDIMFLIAKSKAYIGTSLHGLITAQSFNIPFVPLNKKVKKMDSYCKTWANPVSNGCIEFENINQLSVILDNWDFKTIEAKTKLQKELVHKNLAFIYENLV